MSLNYSKFRLRLFFLRLALCDLTESRYPLAQAHSFKLAAKTVHFRQDALRGNAKDKCKMNKNYVKD